MGEMRHIAAETGPTHEEFDHTVDQHEPLGLHRKGRDEQHDDRIGMHHAEGQQQPHHGTRSSDKLDGRLAQQPGRQDLDQRRTDAADQIIDQKALRAQFILQRAAEHPQGEHVEEDVPHVGMQEHVGDELIGVELPIGRGSEPQGSEIKDRIAHGQQRRGHEDQDIDDYQILDHRRGLEIVVHKQQLVTLLPSRPLSSAGEAPRRDRRRSQKNSCKDNFHVYLKYTVSCLNMILPL